MSYVPFVEHLGRLVRTRFDMKERDSQLPVKPGSIGVVVRCWPVCDDPYSRPFYDVLIGDEIFTLDIGLIEHI